MKAVLRNQGGLRTSKTVAGNTVRYTWIGDKITSEVGNGNALYFYYDSNNTPVAVMLNGTLYYYVTNLQGDIIAMLDETGTAVVEYSYDAWGNTEITGTLKNTVGRINPLRYRGYYYDTDIGLYYLQSRYYDANIGRFINADEPEMISYGVYNLFSYCENNAVNRIDNDGYISKSKSKFSRTKERDYAFKWYNKFNPKYPNLSKSGGDCTNFVSQCLYAGGLQMIQTYNRNWYCYKSKNSNRWCFSSSWVKVVYLYDFMQMYKKKIYKVKTKNQLTDCAKKAKIGDLIFFDFDNDGNLDHAAIISLIKSNDLYYAAHSNAHHSKSIRRLLNSKMVVYVMTLNL